jgi:GNAT superfamily N-acetyltransferase
MSVKAVGTTRIRPARPTDIPAIQQVGTAAWRVAYAFAGASFIARGLQTWWTVEALASCLETTQVIVAEQDGEVVGVGNLDTRDEIPVIWKLYVHPAAQGAGLGRALLQGLIDLAPPGAARVALEYVAGNEPAAAFYTHFGFTEDARTRSADPREPDTIWVSICRHRDRDRERVDCLHNSEAPERTSLAT